MTRETANPPETTEIPPPQTPPEGGGRPPLPRRAAYVLALAAILLLALYLRTANLNNVQDFNGDQGRDYIVMMDWVRGGAWPLLGPDRAAQGDHALGPGWFYTVAPAMALSGFHPAAGALTVAGLAVLTIFLIADWVRRAAGSRAAALVTAAVMAFSASWTDLGRTLWNPNVLPLGVAGLAWLIQAVGRRPLPALASALALLALLPQWHTAGLLVDAAALPWLLLAAWRVWPELRETPWRARAAWGGGLLAVLALLYVPPLLYELQPGPGNLASYFTKSAFPGRPYPGSFVWRGLLALDHLVDSAAFRAFLFNPAQASPGALALRIGLGLGGAAAFGLLFIPWVRRRGADLSAGFPALLAAGFWVVLWVKGESVQDYYLIAPETALLLLAGWTAGRLLTAPQAAGSRVHGPNLAGLALLLLAGALTLQQSPRAWGIHEGMVQEGSPRFGLPQYGFSFHVAREVAETITRDAGEHPFSVELADTYNFPAHYFYLLRWLGRPPRNDDYYAHAIPREKLGERTYLIVGPGMAPLPLLKGLGAEILGERNKVMVHNVAIYRIERTALPPETKELKLTFDGMLWGLEAVR